MAYQLISGPTFADLPTHIIGFAVNTLGWSNPSSGQIVIPDSDADLVVSIDTQQVSTGNYRNRLRARMYKESTLLTTTYCPSPYIAQNYLEPVALHLFGGEDEQPWLAAVVEYGNVSIFRHLYIGRLNAFGSYDGGEVVCGSAHRTQPTLTINYRDNWHQHLFCGTQSLWGAAESGGVRLAHSDLGGEILAPFRAQTSETSAMATDCVIGGFSNNINDPYIARGQNTFAGVRIFNPINLYLTRPQARFCPIGWPPGVRLVSMTDLGPNSIITVANQTWRCFPQFKKGATSISSGSSNTFMADETSYTVGLAYLES